MAEKKVIKKENWMSNFNLIGKPKISEEYTFTFDQRSEKSQWISNRMNLGIDCGEKHGVIYAEMFGGYSENGGNKIFAHGKKDDGSDDFDTPIIVDWEDRFNEGILEEIGDLSFVVVGLEKTSEDKTFYKKFLSQYDAIVYIKEHLTEDMVVNVRGNLSFSSYNNNTSVKKNITSIVLSKVDDPSKYKATFNQTILLDKDSVKLKDIDKDKGVMYVNARVLDYLKEYKGIKLVNAKGEEKGGQFPYNKQFEFEVDPKNEQLCKTIYEKVFKVKKGVSQITFEGEFIESGAVVMPTRDDLPDEIKALIGVVFTEEEALASCAANGNKERRMVLKKPMIRLVGEEKTPVIQIFPEKYTEDDLVLDYLYNEDSKADKDVAPFDEGSTDSEGGDLDWLNKIM